MIQRRSQGLGLVASKVRFQWFGLHRLLSPETPTEKPQVGRQGEVNVHLRLLDSVYWITTLVIVVLIPELFRFVSFSQLEAFRSERPFRGRAPGPSRGSPKRFSVVGTTRVRTSYSCATSSWPEKSPGA